MLTTSDLQLFIRQGGHAWPGGYQMALLMSDGEFLDDKCARENYRLIRNTMRDKDNRDSWSPAEIFIHWEGEPLQCAHCGKYLPSSYGEVETNGFT